MKTKLNSLFIVLALLGGIYQAAAQIESGTNLTFDVLTTAQGNYTNAVIASKTPSVVFVRHEGGVARVAITNLSVELQTRLGYNLAKAAAAEAAEKIRQSEFAKVNTNRLISFNPPAGMALIPAGSFTMGDSLDGNSGAIPLHTVYVSAFYMDKYDVTKTLWDSVYQWATNHGYSFDHAGSGKAANHPVQTVNWYDSVKWCNARSEQEGRTPAYYTSAAQTTVYRSGRVDVDNSSVKWNTGYRLPTEAEWEKAARGGLSGQRFPWGNTISWSQANYYTYRFSAGGYAYDINPTDGYDPTFETGGTPHTSPVGYFAPNGYGLYDMAGNVWQWCWDWDGSYSSGSQTEPRGPASGSYRVLRGGNWGIYAISCRSANRDGDSPAHSGYDVGFRSVLPPGQ